MNNLTYFVFILDSGIVRFYHNGMIFFGEKKTVIAGIHPISYSDLSRPGNKHVLYIIHTLCKLGS